MKPIEVILKEIGINLPQDGFLAPQEDNLFFVVLWAKEVSINTAITAAYNMPGTVRSFQQVEETEDGEARFEISFDPTDH